MTSRPRKLLVYLDQNFISEMAKPAHGGVRPDFRELYSVLNGGFWNEQLVVLRSSFHDVETSLAGQLKDAIRARRSTLGHVDLASQWDIRESQIVASLSKFFGRPDARPVICYDDTFEDEPDARVGHFDINLNMDGMYANAKEQRQRLAAELDTVRQRILEHSISYALVEAASKECRSTHFVFIDAYQDLPDDFMMQALATPRDGKSSVLGYRVYGRDRSGAQA